MTRIAINRRLLGAAAAGREAQQGHGGADHSGAASEGGEAHALVSQNASSNSGP